VPQGWQEEGCRESSEEGVERGKWAGGQKVKQRGQHKCAAMRGDVKGVCRFGAGDACGTPR
jgi:hypothetical protein